MIQISRERDVSWSGVIWISLGRDASWSRVIQISAERDAVLLREKRVLVTVLAPPRQTRQRWSSSSRSPRRELRDAGRPILALGRSATGAEWPGERAAAGAAAFDRSGREVLVTALPSKSGGDRRASAAVCRNRPIWGDSDRRIRRMARSAGERSVATATNPPSGERVLTILVGVASGAGPGTLTRMVSHISAAEAAQTFPEMIERVRTDGAVFVIEQAGEPICQIAPVGRPQRTVRDLVRLLQSAPRPDDAYLDAVQEIANSQPTLPEVPWEP